MATRPRMQLSQDTAGTPTRFLAFELGVGTWRLGFTPGAAQRPRERQVRAGEIHTVLVEIGRAKPRFGLPAHTRVVSGDEAGRDGFWRHRFLVAHGVASLVVDSSSIEVNRRQRRAKTDRLDVQTWLTMWLRPMAGERAACMSSPPPLAEAVVRATTMLDRAVGFKPPCMGDS